MIKRILVGSTVAVLALGGFAVHSYGQSSPAPVTCYRPYHGTHESVGLKYDTRSGVTLSISATGSLGGSPRTATIPLEIDGEPNPHFDRLYSLALKGYEHHRIEQVCVEGSVTSSEPAPMLSIELRHSGDEPQKVQICSGDRCSDIDFNRRLRVTP